MAEKVAVVTAAGKGIGAAIARALHDEGYRRALLSPSDNAEKLAKELGGRAVTGSVSVPADLERLVATALDGWGCIDVVVNNTGHPPKGKLLEIADPDWHVGLDMILLNVIRMARLVTPVMIRQGGGAFVNLSTYAAFAAFEPEPDFALSATFRAALASWTKVYADQHAAQGIRMNNVLPGFVDNLPEKAERRARIPMGRYARPAEIAAAVAFLASDKASYITGQNLRVDGGMTRSI
jgi:NAD(P)-dependent dehydrogenase (short-subunit alcohol dehydrogenase family)